MERGQEKHQTPDLSHTSPSLPSLLLGPLDLSALRCSAQEPPVSPTPTSKILPILPPDGPHSCSSGLPPTAVHDPTVARERKTKMLGAPPQNPSINFLFLWRKREGDQVYRGVSLFNALETSPPFKPGESHLCSLKESISSSMMANFYRPLAHLEIPVF